MEILCVVPLFCGDRACGHIFPDDVLLKMQIGVLADIIGAGNLLLCTNSPDILTCVNRMGFQGKDVPGFKPPKYPWRIGMSEAIEVACTMRPSVPVVIADALCLAIDALLLNDFLSAIRRRPEQPLVSVRQCRDHPCQLQSYWRISTVLTLKCEEGRSRQGARLGGSTKLAMDYLSWPEKDTCSWHQNGNLHFLKFSSGFKEEMVASIDILDCSQHTLARQEMIIAPGQTELLLGCIPEQTRTVFIALLAPSKAGYHFSRSLEASDGSWHRREDGMLFNTQRGVIISGRQDFPEIYCPDPVLAYLTPNNDSWGVPDLEAFSPFVLPIALPERPVDLTGKLAIEAYLHVRSDCND